MEFGDGTVDARSEAEVVRVDDELGRHRFTAGHVALLKQMGGALCTGALVYR
jgi:hypothetical protein